MVAMHLSSCRRAVTELCDMPDWGSASAPQPAGLQAPRVAGKMELACSLHTRGNLSLAMFPNICEVPVGCSLKAPWSTGSAVCLV